MKRSQRLIALALIVCASVLLALLIGDLAGGLTGIRSFENFTLDLRQQTTPVSYQPGIGEHESEVVLVLFDELSFLETPWLSPFPRAHLAGLINAVAAAGARTIGVDVYLDLLFPRLNAIDGGDDLLRGAIANAGNVILVSPVERTDSGLVATPPHAFFTEVAADVGTAELPASFETFRDGTLAVRSGERLTPSFALAMYAHARGLDVDSLLDRAWESGRIGLPGLPPGIGLIPADWRDGGAESDNPIVPFRIRYVGPPTGTMDTDPPGTFQAIGSSSVELYAMLNPELFQDKIVLLGTGFHAEDRFRTPFFNFAAPPTEAGAPGGEYQWMYGVEIHANALQNIIDGEYVRPLGWTGRLALLFVVAFLSGFLVFLEGAAWGAVMTVVSILGTWMLAFWAWAGSVYVPGGELVSLGSVGSWIPIGTPNLGALLSYVGCVAYVAIVEGKEKRFIKGAFGKYLSPAKVAEIFADPSSLTLGGEKRPLSLLFSDLSGFTTISEDMDAQDLIAHPDRAMRTAILMQRRMVALNERWAEGNDDHELLKVRIGVHTGEVVVGNVGGADRFDYSAIGDAVNLAARLEPANKTYDTLNMVSQTTLEAGKGEYRVRELDNIVVKGKEAPVKVYELLELQGVELKAQKEEALKHYEVGMRAYKEHDWEGAKKHFQAATSACPDDGPSILYITRCEENIADPPPPDWDFVVRRTEK